MDQAKYATYIVAKFLDNNTIKDLSKFNKTALPHDMIFTKYYFLSVMNKWKCCLDNKIFTTELVWGH